MSAINIINIRSAVTDQAMDGQQCAVLGKVQIQTSKPQKIFQSRIFQKPHCVLGIEQH